MGKPTGFMEYERQSNPAKTPNERVKDFSEFHSALNPAQRQCQAARCMNCGVPFCQSAMQLSGMTTGCPLHNLIPEWNDELYLGNEAGALERLLKTASFPEFTGRVCPALCEAACSCGLYGQSVTVRENELYIIENAFAKGWMRPRIPAVRTGKRVAVIGSGPSGLACADILNRRGHNVCVYEKEDRPGGLLMYGIPNMKLDKAIVKRRIDLMIAEGVEFITSCDVGRDCGAKELTEGFDAVVISTGAGEPRRLDAVSAAKSGVIYAVDFLKAVTKGLLAGKIEVASAVKNRNVVIVGGGDTGNDCLGSCIRLGCKSAVQLEMMPKPPETRSENNPWPEYPRVCKTDYGQQEAIAGFGADPRLFQTTVKSVETDEKGALRAVTLLRLEAKAGEDGRRVMRPVDGSERTIPCELLIVAAGFTGAQAYLPRAFGLELTPRGNVLTKNGYNTQTPGVFAAGDARTGQSLVVKAISEGRKAAEQVDRFLLGY